MRYSIWFRRFYCVSIEEYLHFNKQYGHMIKGRKYLIMYHPSQVQYPYQRNSYYGNSKHKKKSKLSDLLPILLQSQEDKSLTSYQCLDPAFEFHLSQSTYEINQSCTNKKNALRTINACTKSCQNDNKYLILIQYIQECIHNNLHSIKYVPLTGPAEG